MGDAALESLAESLADDLVRVIRRDLPQSWRPLRTTKDVTARALTETNIKTAIERAKSPHSTLLKKGQANKKLEKTLLGKTFGVLNSTDIWHRFSAPAERVFKRYLEDVILPCVLRGLPDGDGTEGQDQQLEDWIRSDGGIEELGRCCYIHKRLERVSTAVTTRMGKQHKPSDDTVRSQVLNRAAEWILDKLPPHDELDHRSLADALDRVFDLGFEQAAGWEASIKEVIMQQLKSLKTVMITTVEQLVVPKQRGNGVVCAALRKCFKFLAEAGAVGTAAATKVCNPEQFEADCTALTDALSTLKSAEHLHLENQLVRFGGFGNVPPSRTAWMEDAHRLVLGGKKAVREVERLNFDPATLEGHADPMQCPGAVKEGTTVVTPPEMCTGEMQLFALLHLTLVDKIDDANIISAAAAMRHWLQFQQGRLSCTGVLEAFSRTYRVQVSIERYDSSRSSKGIEAYTVDQGPRRHVRVQLILDEVTNSLYMVQRIRDRGVRASTPMGLDQVHSIPHRDEQQGLHFSRSEKSTLEQNNQRAIRQLHREDSQRSRSKPARAGKRAAESPPDGKLRGKSPATDARSGAPAAHPRPRRPAAPKRQGQGDPMGCPSAKQPRK